MKRPRLMSARDIEYAIKWEQLRAEYFRIKKQPHLVQWSETKSTELEKRLIIVRRDKERMSKLVPREDECTEYVSV